MVNIFGKRKICRPHAGSYSAWVVGGGADGSGLTCSNEYPISTDSWMNLWAFQPGRGDRCGVYIHVLVEQ
jgi:hypothetical protein